MARCEDFPCCGHEPGCCPRFENGVQMDMVCTCGKRLPVDNPTSICDRCLKDEEEDDYYYEEDVCEEDYWEGEEEEDEDADYWPGEE